MDEQVEEQEKYKEVYDATVKLLEQKPEYFEELKKIVDYEDTVGDIGWEWSDVKVKPQSLNKMILEGVIYKASKKRRGTRHHQAVKDAIKAWIEEDSEEEFSQLTNFDIPKDIFGIVEGREDIKDVMLMSLEANKLGMPAHVLLEGVPASGKSVLLYEVERLPGAKIATAGTASKAGLRDILEYHQPRFLIIDELHTIDDPNELGVLLTLMESQKLTIDKHKHHADIKLNTTVFAACNRTHKFTPEFLDRFFHIYLDKYTPEEFKRISANVLVRREGISQELADYVVNHIYDTIGVTSIRDPVKISRLARTRVGDEFNAVDSLINVLLTRRKPES